VSLRSTGTLLFDPFWPPYTAQIHVQSVARTPFRTVSEGEFSEVRAEDVRLASCRTQASLKRGGNLL
jgi:hypothetical protein